ncbi:hypothetical protein CNEO_170186 [Clostridium neonatale]|nr:hypothetical protein CNEO_170186 [Clostridium neonatale]
MLHSLINGCHTIGRLKYNIVTYPTTGIKANVKSFLHTSTLIKPA